MILKSIKTGLSQNTEERLAEGGMDANLLGIGNLNANSPPHKRSLTLAMTFSFGLQPFIYLKHQGLGYLKRKDLLVIILFLLNVFFYYILIYRKGYRKKV